MLTFHSSEVEEVVEKGNDVMLDVKVLPDRAPYALSHRGIALELAAALGTSLAKDPLREPVIPTAPSSDRISVRIDDPRCARYMATLIEGVTVGPSPAWLTEALESVGQRSINNVVDATNYVMLNIGQPLHAFDAAKIGRDSDGKYSIAVRGTLEGERITTLTGEEYALPEDTLVIADGTNDALLGIAGVKGGKAAEVTGITTDLIIESASFDATAVRRASQALKLWTDASQRFQNKLSSDMAAYGMRDVVALILDIANGEASSLIDVYPNPQGPYDPVQVSLADINGQLGTDFGIPDIEEALTRLTLEFVRDDEAFSITPPFERRDVVTMQDVAEEVGRVLGYDRVTSAELPVLPTPPDQLRYQGIERIKDLLLERGYTEISTQSFAPEGEIMLANPLQMERPWLRATLAQNMQDALERAVREAPLVLGPDPAVKLFELGTVFKKEGEHLALCVGYRPASGKAVAATLPDVAVALADAFADAGFVSPAIGGDVFEVSLKDIDLEKLGAGHEPVLTKLGAYRPFSSYPFATRDIAVWVPNDVDSSEVSLLIGREAGALLARMDLFDRFEKEERTSYAFRLVFQSNERTLADTDLDPRMQAITEALAAKGWEVR